MKFKMEIIARNIVNPESITDFISKVSKGQSDKIKTWCNTILKNYLKNDYDNLKDVTKSKKSDPDWLKEAVKRKDAQKIVIDNNFERLLIEHIFHYFDTLQGKINYSFSEAEKATKEWENKENLFNIKLTKGVKEVLKCKNNFAWFEIVDEETLYNEGEIIQNCLRKKEHGPEYWKKIKSKKIKIFTLRDSKGVGHVGVEYYININFIKQMNGKQNDDPIEIYHHSCIELIKYLKCDVTDAIQKFLNIVVNRGKIYDIFNLPDGLKIDGTLDISDSQITKLPKNLYVEGSLDISRTKLTELPENLKVGGSLNISFTKIKYLPDNLSITGDINLNLADISELPNNLNIGGSLYIKYTKITELPDDLEIGKFIYIDKNMKLKNVSKHLLNKIKIIE